MHENGKRTVDASSSPASRPLPPVVADGTLESSLRPLHGDVAEDRAMTDGEQIPGNVDSGTETSQSHRECQNAGTQHSSEKNRSRNALSDSISDETLALRSSASSRNDVSPNASDVDDDDDGWEDLEPDTEQLSFKSFLDDMTFPDLPSMLEHVHTKFSFDFVRVRRDLNLDYLETIQLVNYIRSEARQGRLDIDASSKEKFLDHQYLQPVLDNDAVLYSLEDLSDMDFPDFQNNTDGDATTSPEARIRKLEAQLRTSEGYIEHLENKTKYLNDLLDEGEAVLELQQQSERSDSGDAYFKNYAQNTIHVDMLGDKVRTSAYESFVCENKHLFEGKVVLDVGCGTGILSMMCARAGAKQVIAVDNSDIIEKTRLIVSLNNLEDKITCVKGLVQEVTLPTEKVDILVSEWMGYGLLCENMLEHVLRARDKYLAPGGLMVPSHATLSIAPLADKQFMAHHYFFWENVYGFSMTPMGKLTNPNESAVLDVGPSSLAHIGQTFKTFDLHTESPAAIYAWVGSYDFTLERDIERLDGLVVWFDIFFAKGREEPTPSRAFDFSGVAFTTGPAGPSTHWGQCVLPIVGDDGALALKRGEKIRGSVSCARDAEWKYGTAWAARWTMVPAEGPEKEGAMTWPDQTA